MLRPWPLVSLALAVAGCHGNTPESHNVIASANESWCPAGFEPGPQDTCFAIPETHDKNTPIVVYLHGMFTGHGAPEEWNAVLQATKRGFAVVVPRGKRGLCGWSAEVKDHFCWPQEPEDPQAMKTIVAEWDRVLWQVDALLEPGTHKRYVLGFSNGGFFAAFLATRGLFASSASAIVGGGPLAPAPKSTKPTPMLLVSAHEDAVQGPKMKELHDDLTKAGWPHAFCPRPGSHPLTDGDVDAALRFFKRDAEGSLKPNGASLSCDGAKK